MKKVFFVIFLLISFFIINNLIRSIYTTWKKEDLLSNAQKRLEKERRENMRLKSELSVVGSQEFIEKEARDKLFLAKEGEQKVLLPKESEESQKEKKENIPNWQQWRNLFF